MFDHGLPSGRVGNYSRLVRLVKKRIARRAVTLLGTWRWTRGIHYIAGIITAPRATTVVDSALFADFRSVFFELHGLEFDLGLDQFLDIGSDPRE